MLPLNFPSVLYELAQSSRNGMRPGYRHLLPGLVSLSRELVSSGYRLLPRFGTLSNLLLLFHLESMLSEQHGLHRRGSVRQRVLHSTVVIVRSNW